MLKLFNVFEFIYETLRDLVPYLHNLENVKNTNGVKVTLLHECFSCFLNCTNGTILRKAPHTLKISLFIVNMFPTMQIPDRLHHELLA